MIQIIVLDCSVLVRLLRYALYRV